MHDIDPTAAAVFTLVVLGGAAAVYLFALVRIFAWFYTEWRKERADRRRQPDWPHDMSRDALADILDPPTPTLREQVAQAIVRTYRTGSPEGSGNERVVGGKQ